MCLGVESFLFFGSCILGTFRQFCFTFPSLISETNVSFYKKVSFAAADETALQGLSCYVNTAQEHSPGDKLGVLRTGGANRQSFFLALCLKNNSLLFKDEM